MVDINVPIPVPIGGQSFGGWKDSLLGDTKAHGPEAFHFFSRENSVTRCWLDPSHRASIVGSSRTDRRDAPPIKLPRRAPVAAGRGNGARSSCRAQASVFRSIANSLRQRQR